MLHQSLPDSGRQNTQCHVVLAGELHGADLQDPSAEAGKLQHLFEGDRVQAARLRHDPWIGSVDAVHIRIDLAFPSLQGRRQRDRRGVRSSASQSRDIASLVDPLKSGHHRHMGPRQRLPQSIDVDTLDACLGVACVGADARLAAGEGSRCAPFGRTGSAPTQRRT